MDDDKVTQILSWEEQMPASENRQPPGSLDLNDNWPLFQFPMRDSCNPGSESYPRILPPTFCTWPYTTPSKPEHMSSQDQEAPP